MANVTDINRAEAAVAKRKQYPFTGEWLMNARRRELQTQAHARVAKAVRLGLLPRIAGLRCVDCGKPAQAYDHANYAEPLVVEPVCTRCNVLRGPGLPWAPSLSFKESHDAWSEYKAQPRSWRQGTEWPSLPYVRAALRPLTHCQLCQQPLPKEEHAA